MIHREFVRIRIGRISMTFDDGLKVLPVLLGQVEEIGVVWRKNKSTFLAFEEMFILYDNCRL
jgi:hypothetical protein